MKANGVDFNSSEYVQDRIAHIEQEALRQRKELLQAWATTSGRAMLLRRRRLATWDLTIDDPDVTNHSTELRPRPTTK